MWSGLVKIAAVVAAVSVVSGCEDTNFSPFSPFKGKDKGEAAQPAQGSGKMVERDVESPDVFQSTEPGLWDGRPSLGGVWVAHPDVADPERAIIRNKANGKFVIGALFRRERENPGPKYQVSSDAAEALGMLAGQPAELNVTALRKEKVAEEGPAPADQILDAPESIKETKLDALASAAAAIDSAQKTAPKPAAKPSKKSTATPRKPYIQLGIFNVKTNATNTAASMRNAGIAPVVKKQSSSGKTFWRVLAGPFGSTSEGKTLLKKIKKMGFSDAYFVTN
ncbi:MAG: SPOR domain-containing protein [Rhodobacterales bacterium]|nr:MAG: SPOR domain-containing protein [Rhodobacterales bacterium]